MIICCFEKHLSPEKRRMELCADGKGSKQCKALRDPLHHAERNGRRREDCELLSRSWSKSPAVRAPSGRDECAISKTPVLHRSALVRLCCDTLSRVRADTWD